MASDVAAILQGRRRGSTTPESGEPSLEGQALLDQLRGDELRSIQNDVDTDLRGQILKALDERGRAQELIRQQYSGRYPFELLQNANDAAADGDGGGRVLFAVTDSALMVADEGVGFGPDQIRAICGLGRSSKDPRKSIGYKGLGFKSVGEITDTPQIVSTAVAFGFDASRARAAVEGIAGLLDETQQLPVYAFPFGLSSPDFGPDGPLMEELLHARGFSTVLRLPFRRDVVRETVQEHIRQTITRRLLLFLDATDSLELTGTSSDFDAAVVREISGDCTETLLQSGEQTEHWLVFRRALTNLDRAIVDPLGDAWKLVEQVHVAVAVPLDSSGLPSRGAPEPLHVYFPSEEKTGLSVILHGDFALDLDRRHAGHSPEMLPYNEWLGSELAGLLVEVAEGLADRFPGDASVVGAIAPVEQPSGFGEYVWERCIEQLRGARFIPVSGKATRTPNESVLLPATLPSPDLAHRFLDLEEHPSVVVAAIEADSPSRRLLTDLGTPQLRSDAALDLIQDPGPADDATFYEFLVEWGEHEGRGFASGLNRIPCVRTLAGEWVAPSTNVFFPRQREEFEFPEGLRVPIVAVPEVDGLRPLLETAGVRSFEWRQLIPEFVLPLLTDPTVQEGTRQAAFVALRSYYEAERTGDPRIRSQIAQVLLPARIASGSDEAMRSAGSLYFSQPWLGHDRLERIYGPFGETEFLALDPPDEQELRLAEQAFLQWVGVAAHPRVDERRADQRDLYTLGNLARHPHRRYGQLWTEWQADEVHPFATCEQGHAAAQQLRSSFALDRFTELAATRDSKRLALLWMELCSDWSSYEPALVSEIKCTHGWHGGDTVRTVPSLLQYALRCLEWVPCILRRAQAVVAPDRAWRITAGTPPRVAERVAVLDPALDVPGSAQLVAALSVVDAARPAPENLVALLRDLADGFGETEGGDGDRNVELAARWAMRTLNEVLDKGGSLQGAVPLLSRFDGRHVFADEPLVASDPLLAETWEPVFPILDADRDLRRLHEALGLRVLDTDVVTYPDPRRPRQDRRLAVEAWINEAKPFVAAVAVEEVPSRQSDVFRGLARLEVSVCEDLVLRYELDGEIRERDEAVSYIAERIEQEGIIRRRIGTAHLELDPTTGAPHWYSFGPQLAQFLGVPNLGDAFALLLAAAKTDREQYLAARRIPLTSVEEARLELAQAPSDDVIEELLSIEPSAAGSAEVGAPENAEGDHRTEALSVTGDRTDPTGGDVELPPLDHSAITITEVPVPAASAGDGVPSSGRQVHLGPQGPVDHERQQRLQRRIGHRGEEAAYEAERRRLAHLGRDPALVVWRSEDYEFAPYDIESLDEDGQHIYIEVKSTTSDDPYDPFEISEAELLFALRKRTNYYIYRVTETQTACPSISRFRDLIGRLHDNTARLRLSGARLKFVSD